MTTARETPAYAVTGYKSINTQDGEAFNATIRQNGQPFLCVENTGTGGPNTYYPAKGVKIPHGEALDEYVVDARTWARANGEEFAESSEIEDLYTEHLINEASLQKSKAKMAKKGFPFVIVIKVNEYREDLIGVRTFDAAAKELATRTAAGENARLL